MKYSQRITTTMYVMPTTMPRVSRTTKEKPAWSRAIAERRFQLGKRQEDVAADGGMDEDGNPILNQGNITDAETGRIPLLKMGYAKVVALARGLNWTLTQMQDATGIDLGVTSAEPLSAAQPTPVYSLAALGRDNPKPEGFNITPHPGPHPQQWMQTFMDGDDMTPTIRDGESIYFDTAKTTPDKGVYVIQHDGRAYVRRYSTLPSGPAWTADNPTHALNFIPASSSVSVLGKVYRVVGIREAPSLLN